MSPLARVRCGGASHLLGVLHSLAAAPRVSTALVQRCTHIRMMLAGCVVAVSL